MRIFNIEIGKRKVRDQYSDPAQGSFVSRWARPPSRNTAEWLDMFSKSPRLAVVDRIASDLSSLSGKLYRTGWDGEEMEVTSHPFLDFMAHPNPLYEMTGSAIWRLHEVYFLLAGEGYLLIERDQAGRPVELWNVPPHWVKMTPYLGSPTYTILSPGGLSMTVPVDDMFVMKRLNPLDPSMRGLGEAESIADEVEIDEYTAKFQKRFFYNDATPPVVFVVPESTKEQREEFLARWNKRHKGVENSHKAAVLAGNVTVHELGKGEGKNLGFIESRAAMRDAVLEHFGVPREIMGITDNSNRATADSAQYIYAKNVLTPRILAREEAINTQLLPMFGQGLIWRYDPIIPYDKAFDRDKALSAYKEGVITKNEARALMDFPAVEGGDVFKVSIDDLFLDESQDPAGMSQELLKDRLAAKAAQGMEKSSRRLYRSNALQTAPRRMKARHGNISGMLQREEQVLQDDGRLFEAAVSRHFASQRSQLASAMGTKARVSLFSPLAEYMLPDGSFDPELWGQLPEGDQQRLTEGIAGGLLDWGKEAEKLLELFTPLWEKSYDDGAGITAEYYGVYAVSRPSFETPAKVNGAKRIVGIEDTTRAKIADSIAKGISEGTGQNKLKKIVLEEMDPGTTEARAKLIARQETMTALATGQFDMMKAAGATKKTWHHRPQNDPRDGTNGKANHVILDGETVGIDETFSNGMLYPKDPRDGRAEEVINCRCYLTYDGWGEAPGTQGQQASAGNVTITSDGTISQQKWKDSLTEDEKEALHVNTGPDNRGIQLMLRGEIEGNEELKKLASNVESALEKASLSEELEVKRGTDIHGFKGLFGLPKDMMYREISKAVEEDPSQFVGKIVSDDAFLSTSLLSGRSFKGVARYHIKLGEGTHAAYVTDFADGLGSEKEVLIQRRTKFKVTGIGTGVDDDMGYDIIQVFMETV